MLRFLSVISLLFFNCFGETDLQSEFEAWKLKYNKHYSDEKENNYRFKVWASSYDYIKTHNAGKSSYTLAVNKFADLTKDEFKYAVHGHSGSCLKQFDDFAKKHKLPMVNPGLNMNEYDLPQSVDWANSSRYVTPVKNQGDCGSCWAFSATGSTESRYAIATGTLNSLSEQELVDCSDLYGNEGCDGGYMDAALLYIKDNNGLSLEEDYTYKGRNGECKKDDYTHYDPISGIVLVEHYNETALMAAVVEGPVSIGVEADQSAFQFYDGGVLDGKCGTAIDHGVLVVGYGEDSATGQKYWKVKNSWGEDWGEDGYLKICRDCDKNGEDGECCILCQPSYPTVS